MPARCSGRPRARWWRRGDTGFRTVGTRDADSPHDRTEEGAAMTRTICEGLQVLELGAGSIGASLAGMLFADHGARVVKVEPPDGDRLRSQHPAGFLAWNRGK